MDKEFKVDELQRFVRDHVQSKVDHDELHMVGFDMLDVDNFKREYRIYEAALFEGLVNGIIMCGGAVEGVKAE